MSSGRRHRRDESEDFDDNDEDETTGSEDESTEGEEPAVSWFYPMPLGKLVLFGLLGSSWFCMYWAYRCWRAYRAAWGYSKRDFWRKVHAATGFRVSPFWRGALAAGYLFALFPAVRRECQEQRLPGPAVPIALAFLFGFFQILRASWPADSLMYALWTPVWALVPVQAAINRLSTRAGAPPAFHTTAGELAFVALGGLSTLLGVAGAGG